MKKAFFTTKVKLGSVNSREKSFYGIVTLKDDGKISITNFSATKYNSCAADRYIAKQQVTKMVSNGFVSTDTTEVKNVEEIGSAAAENSVAAALVEKTQDFKGRFIKMTKEAAKRMHDNAVEKSKRTLKEWLDAFAVEYNNLGGDRFQIKEERYNKSKYYGMCRLKNELKEVASVSYEVYEASEVRHAEEHYKSSIMKLASRLRAKGIVDGSEFVITNEQIGVNLHMTIRHGEQITKAWTIVAEGPIQRAHYRYLVK